jgi:F-type H+-transporting ATPase subunit a
MEKTTPFEKWDVNGLQPQIITIIITTIIICSLSIYYFIKNRKKSPTNVPDTLSLIIEMILLGVNNMVLEIMGPRFKKCTPFFVVTLLYIGVGSFVSILGFEPATTSYTVTLSLSLVTFIGMYYIGIKYNKISFFTRFMFKLKIKGKVIPVMINPFEIAGGITPLISLSFRMWGNINAGAIILAMIYGVAFKLTESVPVLSFINIQAAIISPIFHIYFDIVGGVIQAYVFLMLTMMYWSSQIPETNQKNLQNQNQDLQLVKSNNLEVVST